LSGGGPPAVSNPATGATKDIVEREACGLGQVEPVEPGNAIPRYKAVTFNEEVNFGECRTRLAGHH
jgi:hypothetical protein